MRKPHLTPSSSRMRQGMESDASFADRDPLSIRQPPARYGGHARGAQVAQRNGPVRYGDAGDVPHTVRPDPPGAAPAHKKGDPEPPSSFAKRSFLRRRSSSRPGIILTKARKHREP